MPAIRHSQPRPMVHEQPAEAARPRAPRRAIQGEAPRPADGARDTVMQGPRRGAEKLTGRMDELHNGGARGPGLRLPAGPEPHAPGRRPDRGDGIGEPPRDARQVEERPGAPGEHRPLRAAVADVAKKALEAAAELQANGDSEDSETVKQGLQELFAADNALAQGKATPEDVKAALDKLAGLLASIKEAQSEVVSSDEAQTEVVSSDEAQA